MTLSKWPEDIVTVRFDDEMFVKVDQPKSIGLVSDLDFDDVEVWIPKSQIVGDPPGHGESVEAIDMPRWLAEQDELPFS